MASERKNQEIKLNIEGVHCTSCKMLIEDALQELGATNVKVTIDPKTKTGTVAGTYSGDLMDVVNAIKKEGYKVKK